MVNSLNSWIQAFDETSLLTNKEFDLDGQYNISDPLIAAAYDPFENCIITTDTLEIIADAFLEGGYKLDTSKPLPLFQDAYVATKILRSALTPNLYVFTDEDKPTNAILLLERGKQNKFLQACETFGLCGVVYSP